MTGHVVAIVVVVGGAVIMSALSLLVGMIRGENSPESDSYGDACGKPSDRPRHSPLSY